MATRGISNSEANVGMVDAGATALSSPLRGAFGRSHLPEDEVSFIHKLARFEDNMELLGQASGSIESRMERGAKLVQSIAEASSAIKEQAKRSFDTIMFLSLLDQHIAGLERDLAQTRSYFEDKWTCNGFVPVSDLIMPPLLRTPAG